MPYFLRFRFRHFVVRTPYEYQSGDVGEYTHYFLYKLQVGDFIYALCDGRLVLVREGGHVIKLEFFHICSFTTGSAPLRRRNNILLRWLLSLYSRCDLISILLRHSELVPMRWYDVGCTICCLKDENNHLYIWYLPVLLNSMSYCVYRQ